MSINRLIIICILCMLALPEQSFSWKALTHMYLAEEAIKDALTDDSVTLYKSDGTILGTYAANKEITAAVKNYPAAFRAGAIGPDAYPDILTGQQLIHPISGVGSCYWLNYLWDCTSKSTLADRAFTAGFFAHGAGDLFGHTYINYFAGGPFTLDTNAVKHTIVEGLIDKSLPEFTTWDNHAFSESDVSISNGLDTFIYKNLVYAPPRSHLGNWLFMGKDSSTSIPKYFSKLRNSLGHDIEKYNADLRAYDDQYSALTNEADKCRILDFSCSKVYLYTAACLTLAEKTGYQLLHGLIVKYKEAWRDDIDSGLKAWPALSHEVNISVNCSRPMNIKRASDACSKYITDHLISMAGAPDFVGGTIEVISSILDAIIPQPLQDAIEQAKKDLLSFMLKNATGFSLADLEKIASDPESQFALIGISADAFKSQELHMSNSTVDYQNVPAMFNTVNMIKLTLMTKQEVERLIYDLTEKKVVFDKDNILLGTWFGSFDESCQWQSACDTCVLMKDSVFYDVFKHQAGESASHEEFAKCTILKTDTADTVASMIALCNSSGYLPFTKKIYIPITLPSDGELSFYLTATKDLAFGTFRYHDSTSIISIKCNNAASVPCRYRAGNYLVEVGKIALMKAASDSMSSIFYNLSVFFKPCEVQGYEHDDSISIAAKIIPNTLTVSTIGFANETGKYNKYEGFSLSYDQYDYYTFSIDSPSGAVISYKGIPGKQYVAVLDSANKIIKSRDFSGSVQENVITPLLTKGVYYIRVKSARPDIDDYGIYSIRLNIIKYPGSNSIAGAVPVSGMELVCGSMEKTDTSKWYSLTLPKKDRITLALETENLLRVKVNLYNQTGSTVIASAQSNDTSQYRLESDSLQPGTYYIEIIRTSGDDAYSFFVSGPDQLMPVIAKVNQKSKSYFSVFRHGSYMEWRLKANETISGTISIIDIKGRIVKIIRSDAFRKENEYNGLIDKKSIAPGVYYLCLQGNNSTVSSIKITVTHR